MNRRLPIVLVILASPAFAESTRQMESHEHGVGELNMAIDGNVVAMEFHAPGSDIVGFEYEATSDEDKAAIAAAIETLSNPMNLFSFPAAAECSVVEAHASLESDADHDEHDEHDEHEAHDEHDDHADHE